MVGYFYFAIILTVVLNVVMPEIPENENPATEFWNALRKFSDDAFERKYQEAPEKAVRASEYADAIVDSFLVELKLENETTPGTKNTFRSAITKLVFIFFTDSQDEEEIGEGLRYLAEPLYERYMDSEGDMRQTVTSIDIYANYLIGYQEPAKESAGSEWENLSLGERYLFVHNFLIEVLEEEAVKEE